MTLLFVFVNATEPTHFYTLSLHDALPIYVRAVDLDLEAQVLVLRHRPERALDEVAEVGKLHVADVDEIGRAHSELQSRFDLVCRLLLEKKKWSSGIAPPRRSRASPRKSRS